MAEWVQKGNLKGPQGDPGQDAQLPAGGTEGQVLTKTSGGEAWADVPQPDMTGVVKKASLSSIDQYTALSADGSIIDSLVIGNESSGEMVIMVEGNIQCMSGGWTLALSPSTINAFSSNGSITADIRSDPYLAISSGQHTAGLSVAGGTAGIQLDSKYVTSITDDASTGSADALATAKAVKDYVDAHGMPSVVPISRGGTGATTAEGAALMVFEHAPEASPTQAGVVKTLSDEDFCAYMGMEYDPADWS